MLFTKWAISSSQLMSRELAAGMLRSTTLLALLFPAAVIAAQPRLAPPTELRVNGVTTPADAHICLNVGPQSDEGLTLSWIGGGAGAGGRRPASAFVVNVTGEQFLWSRCVAC